LTARASSAQSPIDPGIELPFTVTFWCGPPLDELDDRRAAEIAAAGFNVIGPPCEGGYDRERNLGALDVAARHGLRVWVADHRFGRAALKTGGSAGPAVADYRDRPAVGGYFVADEPNAGEFGAVGSLVAEVRAADPRRLAYVNLLPDYVRPADLRAASYADYLERFIAEVNPSLLSYDYYPFGKEKDRSTFFANLTAVASAARLHRLPFMLIALVMPHEPYRDPTEAELSWQVFHALAFGARGISYFAYWTPPGSADHPLRGGLIEGGRRTLHYYQVARLNRQLLAIAHQVEAGEWLCAADALAEIGPGFPIGPIEGIDGGPVTAGLFTRRDGGIAALLVNRDYRYGVRAALRLRGGTKRGETFDPETESWAALGDEAVPLAPGGARLVRWSR
jgi:hypothetical protein